VNTAVRKHLLTVCSFPIVSSTDAKTAKILLIVVIAVHAGLGIAIKVVFFQHKSPVKKD